MSVSVLIPAFRPRFLAQAISSVLTQGHTDLELIVSDDSGGEEVLSIVERFRDARIDYVRTAGRTGAIENMRGLWRRAKHDLVKYLFDDDLLAPRALSELVDEISEFPEASFAFGRRHVIDENGRVRAQGATHSAARIRLDHQDIADQLVGTVSNPIGEFSNVLINRACGITETDFLMYQGLNMHVVTDVGFFLSAGRRGPGVGIDKVVGAFRKHAEQNSSPAYNPWFAVGICEWEMFIRGEYSAGALTKARALLAIDKLLAAYARWSRSLPEVGAMAPGLAELKTRVEDGETAVLDDDFRKRWKALEVLVGAGAERVRAERARGVHGPA